ncbi:uclacyanin 1 [Juglans microcarpa x Juglans regia]|uniref:uclacyanin 1 n=1 Tax=Juglans microcarpa x Juglans regia TaxID=2249226 RepID=UPI001B7E92D9|nr:uclacyanin 1 [Juglans microcarpa x Juglans regia]
MAMLRTLMSLAISGMLIKLAMAASYTVGGLNGGWDTTTNLQTWASSQSFVVGDNLIFQYAPNHDVVEVSKADYDSCQANNPIQSYNGGTTTIPLSSPGSRYFVCGTLGHCSQGMKVEIDTLAASAPTTASPPAIPPASSVTLVPTPAPESSTSSPAPVPAPESTSPQLLTPSPSDSPLGSPASSSIIPSTESTRTSSSGSSTEPPPPSAAHKDSFLVIMTMGLSLFVMMMLQAY